MRTSRAALAAVLGAAALPGCASWISSAIVRAPNASGAAEAEEEWIPSERVRGLSCHALRVEVGPPAATLSVWVLGPPREEKRASGTLVVLHGYRNDKLGMLPTARRFLEEGYRTVLVDLRGHGRSSGQWIGFGAFEAEDLRRVLDELEGRGLVEGPGGVYGISYGGAVALQWAARDPRVRAVVSVAAFSSMRAVVSRYVRFWFPLGRFAAESWIQKAIDGAGVLGGFNPDLADPAAAVARTNARILLLHGTRDLLIPSRHAQELREASGGRCDLRLMEGLGHQAAFADRDGAIARESLRWFGRWLSRPRSSLPSRPALTPRLPPAR